MISNVSNDLSGQAFVDLSIGMNESVSCSFIHGQLKVPHGDPLEVEIKPLIISILQTKEAPVLWNRKIKKEIESCDNNPSIELSELLSALNPYWSRLDEKLPIVQYGRRIGNLPKPSTQPSVHVDSRSIRAEWAKFMSKMCLDWSCRGACGQEFIYKPIKIEKNDLVEEIGVSSETNINQLPQIEVGTPQTTSASSSYSNTWSNSPYISEESTPEPDDSSCKCGIDHSSTQSNVDQETQASSNQTSSAKKTSEPSSGNSSSTRTINPTGSGGSGGNDGSGGGGSHSCGDPGCNIDHGKKVETPELPHNPNACTDANCTIDHNHSAQKSPAQSIKKNAVWAWGIFAACALGLIALIVNGIMNKKDESEALLDSKNTAPENQAQGSISSIQSVLEKQKSLTSSSQAISRKPIGKVVIPISSSPSRSRHVNNRAVTQTRNPLKNSQDLQNQAA